MAREEEFMFRNATLPQSSFKYFAEMRNQNKFCDFEITLGDQRIVAHSVILAAAMPRFQEMSLHTEEILISKVHPNAFGCLIDYAYNCELKITTENVKNLLSGTCYLCMEDVQDACCDFLAQRLHPENVLDFRDLAEEMNIRQLKKSTYIYVKENFEEVSKTKKFLSCPFTYVKDLFGEDDLNVDGEEKVLEAALRWVKGSVDERKYKLAALLRQVRMVLLGPSYLTDVLEKEKLIRMSIRSRDLLDEARGYNLFPKKRKTVCSFSTKPRDFLKISKVTEETTKKEEIYTLKTEVKCTVRHLDLTNRKWSSELSWPFSITNGCVAVLNRRLYFFISSYVFRYDPNSNKSDLLQQFTVPRYNAAAVSLRNKIYVCGGCASSGTASNTVDCYDPDTNEWTQVSSLQIGRRSLNAVSVGNFLYVLGGADKHTIYDIVERYSFVTGKWQYMSSMLTPRYCAGAAVLNGKIYVCGGCTNLIGTICTATAEVYNPLTNKWNFISSMNTARSVKTLLVSCGRLYAIGINDSSRKGLNWYEVYDPQSGMWTHWPSPDEAYMSSIAVVM